ncbi:MAG: DUF4350 domain-containing protein [Gammaproteobacteria bacterium]|nr:DUF4350 domain-containing protein [Gammaproteobacteria bacterium]
MAQTKQVAYSLLGSLLLTTLGWGVYQSIEFYEDTEKSSWSIEALSNPYLATQQFLQASEINVREADSLLRLDSLEGVGTVLITDANQVANPRQLKAVLNWLEQGGSLIVTANSINETADLLLEEFNVEVDYPGSDDTAKRSAAESLRDYNRKIGEGMTPEEIATSLRGDEVLTHIKFDENIGTLSISFAPYRILSHPHFDDNEEIEPRPFSWSSSDKGVHLMQFNVGEGLLTIISDPSIWHSRKVDKHDHAYLLWILSATNGDFAILRPTYRESLWSLISTNAYESLIALTVLTLLWLWHKGQRFGSVLAFKTGQRRALSEHFSATANYLWHRKASEFLLRPIRQQIFRRAHITIPEFAHADSETRMSLIAMHSGINRQTVCQILQAQDFNEISFVRTVKLLKQIEQSL